MNPFHSFFKHIPCQYLQISYAFGRAIRRILDGTDSGTRAAKCRIFHTFFLFLLQCHLRGSKNFALRRRIGYKLIDPELWPQKFSDMSL